MRRTFQTLFLISLFFSSFCGVAQVASFTTPDTVCTGTLVTISDVSGSASSYYWNFCVSNINETTPTGVNLGNIGNQLRGPVFMDYAYYNGNYYGFVVNHNPSSLVRLDFGNSLLNTPTAVPLGNFGGIIQTNGWGEGIQVIQSQGNWYAIIVGGHTLSGSNPSIIKIEFGTNLANPSPIATDWHNIDGAMNQPIDLHLFQDGSNWYGLSTNAESNTLTRFNFGTDFADPPAVDDLGNVGGLFAYPTGVFAINHNGDWKVFVVNGGDRTRSTGTYALIRLDFGSSLLNTPTAVNLGNPGNLLQHPRDITILKSCGQIIGLAVNGHLGNSNITKYDFSNNISAVPAATNLGNIGNLSFPHSISQLFREGDNLYAFITNVDNNTITRLQFAGCTNSSIPSSTSATPLPITYNTPGTYNINLTVDDGLPTQSSFCRQVVVVPEPVHTPLQTILLSPGESVKVGTGNVSGSYQWNTTNENTDSITVDQEGLYFVETTGYGCRNVDSFRIVFITADFSFQQDLCNPLSITFKNEAPGSTVVDWDFGNGQNAPGAANPTILYTSFNNYDVTLTIINSSGNNESVTKSVAVHVQTDSLIITNDTTICEGMGVQLNAIDALNYCWTPAESLSAADIANPVATPPATTTYYLNSLVTGSNIITNGDFSQGNTSFQSDYKYANLNLTEGEYFIGAASKPWNSSFESNCGGRSGTGNMMMVNGDPVANAKIWTQTVNVSPNTNYAFSTWIQSLFRDNPAQLMFSINGIAIGNVITASLPICNWTQFYTTWNSGNNTTATIAIVNNNTLVWGNDFALDDIVFAPVTIKRDSIVITVEKPPVVRTNKDTLICEGSFVQLNTTGAGTYSWTPATALSATNIANPQASPVNTTEYIVTGSTPAGCQGKDAVVITVNPKPVISIHNDTSICANTSIQLKAEGGAGYIWWPAATLDNPGVFNPTASPHQNTMYTVQVTDANNCTNTDSVEVRIRPYPQFTVSNDTSMCEGAGSLVLKAGGGNSYQWSPEISLNDHLSPNPVASPGSTTQYAVQINDTQCGYDTTMHVKVTVDPSPVVAALKSNDINCAVRTAELRATGADSYLWSPASSLDNAARSNPVASVDSTTTFTVKGSSLNGCSSTATVTVKVTTDGNPLFLLPNAFTPNGDGINDCFGIAKWGRVQLQQFSVFNRWGELVYTTKDPSQCWDGTFNGTQQPSGTFVYVIKARTFCGVIDRKGLITLIR